MDLYNIYTNLDIYILVLLRISGYIFLSPLLGSKSIPSVVKIGISLVISYILIITNVPSLVFIPKNIGQYILICINETLRGMLLGFISIVFFSIFSVSGKLMDVNIGFYMGEVLDPRSSSKGSLTGNLLNIIAFLIFLILNGHLQMIQILSDTYSLVPIGTTIAFSNIYNIFISSFSLCFLIGLKLALPLIIIMLIAQGIMGMIIKFIPQMNIFVVGIPLKILVGIFSLYFLIVPFMSLLDKIFNTLYEVASNLFA